MATLTISDTLASRLEALAQANHTSIEAVIKNCLESPPNEADNLYQLLLENCHQGVWHTDLTGTVIYSNQRMSKLLGYTVEEMLGRPVLDFVETALHAKLRQAMRARQERGYYYTEITVQKKDGTSLWVQTIASNVYDRHGMQLGAVILITDVAEQNQLETILHANLYRSVIENMVEGIIVRHPDGIIFDCNASAERILGMTRDQLIGKKGISSSWTVLREDGTQLHEAVALVTAQTGQAQRNVITNLRKDDQISIWLSINTHPLFLTDDNKPSVIVSVFTDITAQRRATREAEKSAAYWQYMSDLAFEGLVITEEGIVTDVNNRLLEILGYDRDEIIGMPVRKFVAPTHIDYVTDQLKVDTTVPYEHLALRKDGTTIPVEVQGRMLQESDRQIRVTTIRDVSEQRKMKRELEKVQALLAAAVEQSPAGIIIADVPDLEIQLVNQAALITRGYDISDDAARKQYYDLEAWRTYYPNGALYPLDKLPLVRAASGEIINSEEMRNANDRWLLVNAAPVRNAEDEIIASITVSSDITERKQAEEALRRSEERYRTMLEISPVAITVLKLNDNKQATIVYANSGALKLHGARSKDELIGRAVVDFTHPSQYAKQRERVHAYFNEQQTLLPTEYMLQSLDGRTVYAAVSSITIEFEGEPCVMSVLTDITAQYETEAALRQSEERYRRMLENAPVGIFVVEIDGRNTIRYINPAGATLFAAENSDQLLGMSSYDLMPPETIATFEQRVDTLTVGNETPTREYALLRLDGERIYVRGAAIPITYDDKNSALIVVSDVTERHKAETALRQSEERLRLALNSTGTGIWEWEIASNDVQWSENIEPIFGLDQGAFAGTFAAYFDLVHPDDREVVTRTIETSLADPSTPYFIEHRTVVPHGKQGWIEAKGIVFRNPDGTPIRMLGIVGNITERKEVQLALQAREASIERQNEALLQLTTLKALGTGDLDTALRDITRTTSETLDVNRVGIWLYVQDATAIVCEQLYNASAKEYEAGMILEAVEYPAYFTALAQNRIIVAHNASTDPATSEFAKNYLDTYGITSMLDAPIRVGGKTIGVVCNEHRGLPRQWTLDDQHFVSAVADLVALAIESRDRRQAETALRHSEETALEFQEKLRQIHDITLELSQVGKLEDMYQRAVELGRSTLGFDRFALFMIDEQAGLVRGTFGTDEAGNLRDERYYSHRLEADTVALAVVRSKERVALWERSELKDNNLTVGTGWNAMAVLWNGSEGIGWLVTDNLLSEKPPRPYEMDLLSTYATTLGNLITQQEARDALRASEATALAFQQQLRKIHDIAVDLSQEESLDNLYRRAVEMGRSELNIDRMGLWLIDKETNIAHGTFGTDERGQTRDERTMAYQLHTDMVAGMFEALAKKTTILSEDVVLVNERFESIGRGWNVRAILWNGTEGIGWISSDNLLSQRSARPYETDLLSIYATALGSLITQRQSEEQLKQLVDRLTLLAEIDRLILRSDSPQQIAEAIIQPFKTLMACDYVCIIMNDITKDAIYPLAHSNEEVFPAAFKFGETAKNMIPNLLQGEVVQMLLTPDLPGGLLMEYLLSLTLKWLVVVPLLQGETLVGSIVLGKEQAEALNYEQTQTAQQVAAQLSVALQQATLHRQIQSHSADLEKLVDRLQLMAQIDSSILRSDSPETIAQAIVFPLKALIQCDYVSIILTDMTEQMIKVIAHTNDTALLSNLAAGPFAQRMAVFLQRGEIVQSLLNEELPGGKLVTYLHERGITFIVMLPLLHDDVLVGTVILGYIEAQSLSEDLLQSAEQVTAQLAVALRQSTLHRQVQDYAGGLEIKVRQRTSELEEKAHEMEAFTYSVSHDLRAPLRAINGFADLLLEVHNADLPEKAQHYLNRIYSNSIRMGELIDDLLSLSRIGRQDLKKQRLQMKPFVQHIIDEMVADEQTGIAVIHIGDLPDCDCDAALLKQVFANLISNAIKYSQKVDAPTIHIDFEYDADGQVVYYVRDNGIGFDMKYADKLFGVFQRLHDARDYEGTGIGLATVRRIINRHGGKVWGEGLVHGGATFYFTLPATDATGASINPDA